MKITFTVSSGKRLALLALTFIAGLSIAGILVQLLANFAAGREVAMMRIGAVVQDIFMLVLPAIVTAVIVTRRPATLLAVGNFPGLVPCLLAFAAMLAATPAMNAIIEWNASWHLPESMSAFENTIRELEDRAEASSMLILGPHTIPNLIMSILLVGVMAGFCEELFFRGCLQRLLSTSGLSAVAAIWVTAVIFSAVHFQFFGFVPRILLGAYFGYLLLWSRSIWLPVMAHAFNNSLFVVLQYFTGSGEAQIGGGPTSWVSIILSVALTAVIITFLRKLFQRDEPKDEAER